MTGKTYLSFERFAAAQAPVYESVLTELRAGRKRGHWMWFIFPQLRGLGRSAMADLFAIGSLPEARAYLAHPLLGVRLRECTRATLEADAVSLTAFFGTPDDLKFRSSMTLFDRAADEGEGLFGAALERWCEGVADRLTLELLR